MDPRHKAWGDGLWEQRGTLAKRNRTGMVALAMAKPALKKPARKRLSPKEQARVAEIFRRFEAAVHEPRTELEFLSPFTLLVAVVLSAQATDKSVNKATEKLFAVAATPAKMAALGEAKLVPFIASIGLFRTKARNVIKLSQILLEQYGGEVPLKREALEALPGVGRKTASVVLNELRIEPAIAVDTHVFRVAHRLKLSAGKTPSEVEADLMAIVPQPYLTRAHHWLILHGRYVCLARKPKCEACLISDLCPSRELFL
jgi:endonuclease-3